MGKSLGTLLHFWGVFQFTQAQTLPSPYKPMLDACIQNFFQVSTLYRVGEGRTATGNAEVTENCEYLSTVSRTFIHDCNNNTATFTHASATQVHELTAELEQLPRRAQVAAGFITYLSSAPEDVRKATMAKWCEAAGLQGFDFRRFMSTESEQLGWKAEGLPSDDLSMENALVILKVTLSVCSFNVQLSVFYLEISSSVW